MARWPHGPREYPGNPGYLHDTEDRQRAIAATVSDLVARELGQLAAQPDSDAAGQIAHVGTRAILIWVFCLVELRGELGGLEPPDPCLQIRPGTCPGVSARGPKYYLAGQMTVRTSSGCSRHLARWLHNLVPMLAKITGSPSSRMRCRTAGIRYRSVATAARDAVPQRCGTV
jgi:hypothetical protein